MISPPLRIKKSLTSLDIAVLVNELRDCLTNARIDNIYSVGKKAALYKIRKRSGEIIHLYIEAGVRVNLTKHPQKSELGGRVPIFRRFIRDAKILDVKQRSFERIMIFELTRASKTMDLIVELMPRGVAAVIDKASGKILISDKDLALKDREIRAGKHYSFPPAFDDPRNMSVEVWKSRISIGKDLARGLIKGLGIPPEVVNEVIEKEKRAKPPDEITLEELTNIRNNILSFIDRVLRNPKPVIIECGDAPVSFHPFIPSNIPEGCTVHNYSSMNEAVDEFFTLLEKASVKKPTKEAEAAEARISKTLRKAEEELKKHLELLEKVRKQVLIFETRYAEIESLWECVSRVVRSKGWDAVREYCSINSYLPSRGEFTVSLGDMDLQLTILKSVHEQYIELRKRLAALERKVEKAKESINEIKKKLKETQEKIMLEKRLKPVAKKVEWYTQYHWLKTTNGFLAIGGRDAQQNEKVVRKYLSDNDIFVHAEVHGASAFVIKCDGRIPSETDLKEVATMAVSYSKAWKSGVGALDAFWVWGRQVSKSPPPGQYLPKGSFMIYGKRNFIKGVELKVSIGIKVVNDSYYEVVAGPEHLLEADDGVVAYITVIPGEKKQQEIAKELMEILRETPYKFVGLQDTDIAVRIPGLSRVLSKSTRKRLREV